jgi:hypothetical protein
VESFGRKLSLPTLGLAVIAALFVAVPAAQAAEDPVVVEARKAYRAQVEPICKSSTDNNARILKGVEGQVKKGVLVPAGKRFIRASEAFGKAVGKIAKVPRPSTEAQLVGKWIGYLKEQESWLRKIGLALKAEQEGKARANAVKLDRANKNGNELMIDFEFNYCKISSDKFL